jgi:hypothetical protein
MFEGLSARGALCHGAILVHTGSAFGSASARQVYWLVLYGDLEFFPD